MKLGGMNLNHTKVNPNINNNSTAIPEVNGGAQKIQLSNLNTLSSLTTNNTLGVQLVNRDPTSHSIRDGYQLDHKISNNLITENGWSLDDMMERPTFQSTYSWTQASPRVIAKIAVPFDLLATEINTAPFKLFTFFRGDIEITMQTTATPLHQGMLAAVFVPLTTSSYIEANLVPYFSSMSVNQTCYLYANSNTVAKMIIPFNSVQGYLNLSEAANVSTIDSLGYLYIINLNPIELASTASDTASVSIFARFLNTEFKVPRRLGASPLFAQGNRTSVVNNWDHVYDASMPLNTKGDDLDLSATIPIPGLDNPTYPIQDPPQSIKGTQPMNYAVGPNYSDKMSLYPSALNESCIETFATSEDEMVFDYIKKKYSYVKTVQLSTSDIVGTIVDVMPMNPCPMFSSMIAGEVYPSATVPLPLLSYLSYPFKYWRGGITYKIQVVATSFQTGKLFFALGYGTLASSASVNESTSQYGASFEINQGSNEFEFTVPYVATTPFKEVPSGITTLENSLGALSLVVINPLVAPNNTPESIHLNIFMAGADDFEVNMLSVDNNLIVTDRFPLTSQSDFTTDNNVQPLNTEETDTNLANDNNISPTTNHVETQYSHFGCKYRSIRDIMKKYYFIKNIRLIQSDPTGTATSFDIDAFDIVKPKSVGAGTATLGGQETGMLTWGASMYRQFRGQLRFKIQAVASEKHGITPSFYAYFTPFTAPASNAYNVATKPALIGSSITDFVPVNGTFGLSKTIRINASNRVPISMCTYPQTCMDIEIPYNSRFMSLLTRSGNSENYLNNYTGFSSMGFITIVLTSTHSTNDPVSFNVFASIGDESRFGTIFTVPPVYVNNNRDQANAVTSALYPDSFAAF